MSVEILRWWVARVTPPPQSFPIRGYDRGGCIFATFIKVSFRASECGRWAEIFGAKYRTLAGRYPQQFANSVANRLQTDTLSIVTWP